MMCSDASRTMMKWSSTILPLLLFLYLSVNGKKITPISVTLYPINPVSLPGDGSSSSLHWEAKYLKKCFNMMYVALPLST